MGEIEYQLEDKMVTTVLPTQKAKEGQTVRATPLQEVVEIYLLEILSIETEHTQML